MRLPGSSIILLASALLHYYLWCFPLTKTIKNGCTKSGEKKNSSSITWQHWPNVERQEKERETKRMGKCMHTIRATLPDISLHLEVAILRAEMHISSQHHLHIGLLLREHHRNVTALYRWCRSLASATDARILPHKREDRRQSKCRTQKWAIFEAAANCTPNPKTIAKP
jgi:hypothetical protein